MRRRPSAASRAALRTVLLVCAGTLAGCDAPQPFRTGLEVLERERFESLRGKSVGVVTNPTGVDRRMRGLATLVAGVRGIRLAAIFGPEHGASGTAAAGESVGDARDPKLNVPVYSLYGEHRRPTAAMLEGIDVLLFDIQDVGVRAYTYLSTLVEVLHAAVQSRVEVWVLDRPVPIGADAVEGPVLESGFESFVGPHVLPLRHGLTAGEFARLVNEERKIGARLRVVAMEGYRRGMSFEDTGLDWIPPSPNIPTVETALLYTGMVLVEGTNLSEGRGTATPFRVAGAPWIDGERLASEMNALNLPGCVFRAASFTPSASKHAGLPCGGVEVHVTDRRRFHSVTAAVALIQAAKRLWPKETLLQAGTFDRLAGGASLREMIESGKPLAEIVMSWRPAVEEYLRRRQRFLLYD